MLNFQSNQVKTESQTKMVHLIQSVVCIKLCFPFAYKRIGIEFAGDVYKSRHLIVTHFFAGVVVTKKVKNR